MKKEDLTEEEVVKFNVNEDAHKTASEDLSNYVIGYTPGDEPRKTSPEN